MTPKALVTFIVLLLFSITCSIGAPENSPAEVAKQWAAAFNENDPAKLLAFYDNSDQTEVVVSAGLAFRGYEAIAKLYRESTEEVKFWDSSIAKLKTRVLGDTALVSFEHSFKMQSHADKSKWQVQIRTTTVLHRRGGQWKIVQEHSSPIAGIERYVPIDD